MLFTGLFILIVAVFANCVTYKEVNHNYNEGKKQGVEARYPFNHPPLAEYYNPIPVAVVYEDESAFALQSEISTKASKLDENVEVKVTTEENIPTITELKQLNITNAKSIEKKVESTPKSRSLNDFEIPVVVVYEGDPNNYPSYHRTQPSPGSSKRHLNNRTKQQNKTNIDEQTTEKIEKTESINATKNFKKRTEGRDPIVPIVESQNYVYSHGNFHYRYEGGDGTKAYSEGKLKTVDEKIGEAVVGGFSYTDKDGNDFSLSYTADENGYRPVGAHLPTPPPIPPAIARALAYLATATPPSTTERPVKTTSLAN